MFKGDEITEVLQNVFHDIKAEVVISDLIENGMEWEDFVAVHKGTFKRRYARDIDTTEKIMLGNSQKLTGIILNRDGIYDSLPEGMFHQRSENTTGAQGKTSKDSKKSRQEEKSAREFFLPFENEIFLQRIQLELEERKLLSSFNEKLFDDIYPELWELNKSIKGGYINRMILLLHFAHKIAGNNLLTAKCLQTIINEEVKVCSDDNTSTGSIEVGEYNKTENCVLGGGKLGIDFICGDRFAGSGKSIEFRIGPLRNTKIEDYLYDGPMAKFLSCFYGYFVPAHVDVSSKIIVASSEQNFVLNEVTGGPLLGCNSAI